MKLRIQGEQLEHLSKLLGVNAGDEYKCIGYSLNLVNGSIRDLISKDAHHGEAEVQILTVLLSHYLLGKQVPKTGKLIKFKDLPGGYAYERAFLQRAVQPVASAFGEKSTELVEAAELLGGKALVLGDASAEIPFLEGITLTYIVWAKGEFPATASILYDESASHYLPTEDLAIIAELTTGRLIKAQISLKTKK
jgi:hypothetical protein